MATAWIPGLAKGKGFGREALAIGGEYVFNTGAETVWEMWYNDRDIADVFPQIAISNALTAGISLAGAGRRALRLSGRAGTTGRIISTEGRGPVRVTQYFDPKKGAFPIEGEFALSSKPTFGNRLVDRIGGETTWVAPRPASGMSQWRRFWTGVGNRRHFVEFDVMPGELQSPGWTKSWLSGSQQVIPGRVSLVGRNPVYGVASFNYVDVGMRYVIPSVAVVGGGYVVYREMNE